MNMCAFSGFFFFFFGLISRGHAFVEYLPIIKIRCDAGPDIPLCVFRAAAGSLILSLRFASDQRQQKQEIRNSGGEVLGFFFFLLFAGT